MNRQVSMKARVFVLGMAMLAVTPGGARQMVPPSVMPALGEEASVERRIERKRRDCSLGIPCSRRVLSHQLKRENAIALAAMVGLGIKTGAPSR